MNTFLQKWHAQTNGRVKATGSRVAKPCANCGSTTLRAEGNLWVSDRCTPESVRVEVHEVDTVLAQAVQVLNRAGARIGVGSGHLTITLPQQSDNAMTRQAVRTLYGDTCKVVIREVFETNSQKGST